VAVDDTEGQQGEAPRRLSDRFVLFCRTDCLGRIDRAHRDQHSRFYGPADPDAIDFYALFTSNPSGKIRILAWHEATVCSLAHTARRSPAEPSLHSAVRDTHLRRARSVPWL